MNEKLTDFQQLHVWQKAHQLVLEIFELTKKLNKDEKAELAVQMRSAAVKIPVKIAEGFMRRSPKDKFESYKDSQDAVEAVKYYLILTRDLDYTKDNVELISAVDEVGRMLTGLVRSTKTK
ncbi:four helix bundle protein [bacterium]|nr:four helix bundle protein [bacterium]